MNFKRRTASLLASILFITLACCPFQVKADTTDLTPNSEASILIESSTGKVLFEKNGHQKMFPASTTKVMTAILTLENCDLNDTATASYKAVMSLPSGYSNAEIKVGEEMEINQLLQALLVHSANEAGNVLAEHIAGSIESFATMMNTKANELGCQDTNFKNPSGIHEDDHYSTAYDMALIANYAMKNDTFRKIVSSTSCTLKPTALTPNERTFTTTNDMINPRSRYYYKDANGIKTGYTSEARNCLIAGAKRDNMQLISVVLSSGKTQNGLSGRDIDTKALFDFGFENYCIEPIKHKDEIVKQIEVSHATKETKNLDLVLENDIPALVETDKKQEELSPEITLNKNLSAPINKGQVVGTIKYTIGDTSYITNLLAANVVEPSNHMKIIFQVALAILILFFLLTFIGTVQRKKRKKYKKVSKGKHHQKKNKSFRI